MSRGLDNVQQDAVPMDEEEITVIPPSRRVMPGPRRDEEEYPMSNKPRGRVIVFNHLDFNSNLKLGARKGTEKDEQRLKEIFPRLGFQVNKDDVCQDYTLDRIKKKLQAAAAEDHSKANCIVIVVMTHGSATDIENEKISKLYAYDEGYHETELWKPFLGDVCPTLRGKPKLIFIQACRGNDKERGCLLQSTKAQRESTDFNYEQYSIPNTADILVARSSTSGCRSYRHTINGAVFIQSLCNELEREIDRENKRSLLTMLLAVNREVGNFQLPETDDTDEEECEGTKQMSWFETSLTRQIYFRNLN